MHGKAKMLDITTAPAKGHGGAREQADNVRLKPYGNSAEARIARLKRDFPAIASAYAAGEFKSVAAAWLACWTQEEIAEAEGITQQAVDLISQEFADLQRLVKSAAEHATDFEPLRGKTPHPTAFVAGREIRTRTAALRRIERRCRWSGERSCPCSPE
jgi:hypothetical protein